MLSRFVQRHSYTDTCITAGVPNCHQPADENIKRVCLLPQTLNIYTLKKYLNPGTRTHVELLFFSMFPAEFKYGITAVLFPGSLLFPIILNFGSFWNADVTHTVKVSVPEVTQVYAGEVGVSEVKLQRVAWTDCWQYIQYFVLTLPI